MALINCPDCNKEVSDLAPTCPNCGRPLKYIPKSQPEIKIQGKEEGCFLQTLNAGCMVIFVVIGLIILSAVC